MNNFDWNKFKNEKIAVWCDTEEKAREFVKECYKRGMKWSSSSLENETYFVQYKKDTCYDFYTDGNKNKLMFCDKFYYERNNYKIIKWESEKMNNENTFSSIVNKIDKEFIDSFKTNNKIIKDCRNCIHNRVCLHRSKNEEYKQQMRELIEKWGEDNGFGFTEDCPEWHEQPKNIKFENDSEIKATPCKDTVRGKRAKLPIHYHNYEKCENKDELFEIIIKALSN